MAPEFLTRISYTPFPPLGRNDTIPIQYMQNLHFIKLLDEKNTALDSIHVCMNKLLNNFRQFFFFMLTFVFTVETLETKEKSKERHEIR